MPLTATINCPVCNVRIGAQNRPVPAKGNESTLVDGNFARDENQHVHYDVEVEFTCSNGHRWRWVSRNVMWRLP